MAKKPVMDVSKPGKSPADATARPIITGHEMIKDPMVNDDAGSKPATIEDNSAKSDEQEKVAAPSATHKVIQPIAADDAKEDEPAEPKEAAEEKPETEEAPVSDDAVVDAVLEQVGDKGTIDKLDEEERKRGELVDKLVSDKKYFLPINQVRSRRNNRLALLVLGALLPVLVGLGLAADAGAINLGFKVPFDFIKDTPAAVITPAPVVSQPKAVETKPKLTEFTNKDLGLNFSYPQEWGTTTVKDNTTEKTEKGKRVTITFAAQPKVAIGLIQSTWKDSSLDVNRVCNQPGFTQYVAAKTDLGNGKFVLKEQANYQVYEELTGGLCSDKQIVGNLKFAKNTTYVGMSVVYQDKVTDKFDLAKRIADWQKDKTKYFPVTLTDQITAIITSAKEL